MRVTLCPSGFSDVVATRFVSTDDVRLERVMERICDIPHGQRIKRLLFAPDRIGVEVEEIHCADCYEFRTTRSICICRNTIVYPTDNCHIPRGVAKYTLVDPSGLDTPEAKGTDE